MKLTLYQIVFLAFIVVSSVEAATQGGTINWSMDNAGTVSIDLFFISLNSLL